MRQIKTIIFTAVCVLGLAAFAQQQNPSAQAPSSGDQAARHMAPSVDDQLKSLTTQLNLTADQQAKIKPILEDQHQQAQSVMSDTALSQDDRRNKMRSLHESSSAKVRDVLNDDQKKKFDAWQQEMHDRMRQHPGGDVPK
jgi:Spy/CpxP family protein refolding chaperone